MYFNGTLPASFSALSKLKNFYMYVWAKRPGLAKGIQGCLNAICYMRRLNRWPPSADGTYLLKQMT